MAEIGFELKEKIAALEQALLDRHPTMPTLLREIHTTLRKQPENVTLLSEDQIKVIVNGLQKQTGVELVQAVTKAPGKTAALKSKIKDLGVDAF